MVHLTLRNVTFGYPIHLDRSLKNRVIQRLRGATQISNILALDDICLKLTAGDRLAIIGHNGAGKSTLLRIIAGIYPLNHGQIEVDGRVRSLLDLNLGFDLAASGRDNIRLRASVLGASRQELPALVNAVIEYSELGKFIDFPLNTYSMGMALRLAFGTMIQFDGDILLMDEVISAGDANFITKASASMDELVERSRILLLATHDPGSARRFCNKALVLRRGRLAFLGDLEEGLAFYSRLPSELGGAF